MNDEFYIGWQQQAPARTAKTVRAFVVSVITIAIGVAAVTAVAQRLIGRSVFEWGKVREFSGVLKEHPVPHLLSTRGGTNHFYYLVRPWKFGFDPKLAATFSDQQVRLRGTLIHRDDQAMIEVQAGSITPSGDVATGTYPTEVSLGERTFVGEIVDSKCFLGVMNPGQLKPHRACAVRCISGGVPPVLLVREAHGPAQYLLLTSRDNTPVNKDVLTLVAEPVRITGELVRNGQLLTLRADPNTYQRVANGGVRPSVRVRAAGNARLRPHETESIH